MGFHSVFPLSVLVIVILDHRGHLGTPGSVEWLFQKKWVAHLNVDAQNPPAGAQEIMDRIIESCDVEDVKLHHGNYLEIVCAPENSHVIDQQMKDIGDTPFPRS